MHTSNPRVLENLINKYLEPYITEKSFVISDWKCYRGTHVEPGKIVLDGEPAFTAHLGDTYKTGYHDTVYFEADFTVPAECEGRKVFFTVDFGGEAIIRINEKIVGAVSSRANEGWVSRDDILFPRGLKAGEKLFIQCENAADNGGLFNMQFPNITKIPYTLKTSEFRIINEDAEALYYDMICAWDVYKHTEDKYVAKRLYNAIDTCMHKLFFDLGNEKFYASVPSARKEFWEEVATIKSATPGEVILSGHSHLDIAWLWTVRELNRKTARTFSNNLALMDTYEDFRFTQSQAIVYWFMKERYPEIYERVKEKVKNGQWEITGNTWVEADTNIASGESLVRQLLYGREFFMKEFGVSSDIYWLPDCFGFTAALPQIIKKSGMKYFFTSKLQYNDTNEFPVSVFKWRSPSGDEVLSYMQKVSYNGEGDADYILTARRKNLQNDLVDATMGNFGYGDGGGGCTHTMVERIRRMEKLPGMPEVRMGQAEDFYNAIDKNTDELPVWDGEMYYENHRGTFTSQAFVKQNNRRGEYMMREIEMISLLAGKYPVERIENAWKILLQNQFHDILPGTSIHEVFEDTRREYEELKEKGAELKNEAFTVLNDKYSKDNSVIVWNMHTHKLTSSVCAEIPFAEATVKDSDGKVMNCTVKETDGKFVLEFIAEDVPGIGYKVFTVEEKKADCTSSVKAEKAPFALENEYIRAEFDNDGLISAIFDKKANRQILTGKGNLLTLSHDKPIHESAWNLENDYKMQMVKILDLTSMEIAEQTPVKAVIKQVRKINNSVITQYITLKAESRTLDFVTEVDWHEKEKILKAEFPLDIRSRYSTFEIAHGALERPTFANNSYEKAMFECCAHKWTDLSERDYGVSLLNDCKYGYDITDNVMRITLMRAPVLPDATADIGINTFTYSLYPHEGTYADAETVNEAFALNIPFEAFYTAKANGEKKENTFICVEAKDVILDAVKKAQDGKGLIIRMYEAEGKHTHVNVKLPCNYNITECNLMEEAIENPVLGNGNEFTFDIKPFEVRTFRLV